MLPQKVCFGARAYARLAGFAILEKSSQKNFCGCTMTALVIRLDYLYIADIPCWGFSHYQRVILFRHNGLSE